ncbi:MAG: sigma factor-like helix-turn-helix DNA-binding protein, partial [Verrucomicrobiota bacterium]
FLPVHGAHRPSGVSLSTSTRSRDRHPGIPQQKPAPWKINPRKAYEQKEFWDVYLDCVSKLKGLPQRAYALRELEEMSTEEACEILNVDSNYLWVLIHRARSQLKGCLEENWIRKTKGGRS